MAHVGVQNPCGASDECKGVLHLRRSEMFLAVGATAFRKRKSEYFPCELESLKVHMCSRDNMNGQSRTPVPTGE